MTPVDPLVPEDRLPFRFSVVGVQKAGTSTLSALISEHPRVGRPPKKELHFFDDEKRRWDPPDYADYTAARGAPAEQIVGDNTPRYLFHPHSLRRMHDFDPQMRLVAMFRDPVERLFSQWAMLRERHPRTADWPEFITRLRPATLPREFPEGLRPRRFLALSGVARGYYGAQLERGFEIFGPEQWLVMEFREMLADHAAALDRLTDHLGLEPFTEHPPLLHRMSGPERVGGTPPTADDIEGLVELYAEDLGLFARLSGIDVEPWPTARVARGTLAPAELAAKLADKVDPTGADQR